MIQSGAAGESERYELYKALRSYVCKIASQYSALLRCPDEIEDLMQEAYFAIMDAAQTFDQNAGASFIKWATLYLRRAFENYIGRQTGGSAAAVQQAYAVNKWAVKYAANFGRWPTDKEILLHFEITPKTLDILRHRGKEESADAPVGSDPESASVIELVADPYDLEGSVIERITMEEVGAVLRRFVDDLAADERAAIRLFYYKDLPLKVCAEIMGVTLNEFQNVRDRALRHLRKAKNLETLGKYLPEWIGSIPYRRGNRNAWQSSTERAAILLVSREEKNKVENHAPEGVNNTKENEK